MPDQHEENVYTRSTSSFIQTEPVEQKEARIRESIEIDSQIGLIQEIHAHLTSRIQHYGSIDSITITIQSKPEEFMHVVAANQLAKATLQEELNALEAIIRDYKEEKHIQ
ncbi:MAG: hypothetical protein EOO27_02335 [Comamonadaceae bacterium]|nr:MAG: hypothetical protein EOO27_02335 [Comamonadaceae bacterium]